MVFIDSNIPMYLIGAEHPRKHQAKLVLEKLILENRRFVTNAEVFQEIMHRYTALHRPEFISLAWDLMTKTVSTIFPVEMADAEAAKKLLASHTRLSARDAIHAAHLKRYGVKTLLSFDNDFDQLSFVKRIPQ